MTTFHESTLDSFIYISPHLCKLKRYENLRLNIEVDCKMKWYKNANLPQFEYYGIGKSYFKNGNMKTLFFRNENSFDRFYMEFDSINGKVSMLQLYENGKKQGINLN
jgi:hypothetical protein